VSSKSLHSQNEKSTTACIKSCLYLHRLGARTMQAQVIYNAGLHSAGMTRHQRICTTIVWII